MGIDRELTIQFVMMLLGIAAAIGSIIVFFSARKAEKESKKSELQALKYAEQADEYYKKVIAFYDNEEEKQQLEVELLKKAKEKQNDLELKDKVFAYIRSKGRAKTSKCAKDLGVSNEIAFDVLHELCYVDRQIGTGGSADKGNMDRNIWTSNR
jgi:type II secretory pathway pseudopilin PulG